MAGVSKIGKAETTAEFEGGDWYDLPEYYDAVFDQDTVREADFLEAMWRKFGRGRGQKGNPLRVLEPACGSGRLVLELAVRGHRVEGFDANPRMIEAARRKLLEKDLRARLRIGTLESPPSKGRYDLAHCLLSTIKYVRTERDALAHFRGITDQLVRGGIYVLGIHLTDYGRTRTDVEKWIGKGKGYEVICETSTFPPEARRRLERLRNRLTVTFKRNPGERRRAVEKIETRWKCRTYDADQLRRLLAKIPQLECVACFDFTYDLKKPREIDDTQEDIVLILRKG